MPSSRPERGALPREVGPQHPRHSRLSQSSRRGRASRGAARRGQGAVSKERHLQVGSLGVLEVLILLALVAAIVVLIRRVVRSTVRQELGKADEPHQRENGLG